MNLSKRGRVVAAVGALGWMALIFRLSSLTGSQVPSRFSSLGHFVLYAVLAAAYFLSLPPDWDPWRAAAVAVVLASLYGVSDEFHQSFTPGRVPDVVDWLVDTMGALAATVPLAIWARRRR